MAIKVVPQNIIPKQANIGDSYGDIYASWNLDLMSNPGKFRTSPTVDVHTSSDDVATNTGPVAFVKDLSGTYWAVCNQRMLRTSAVVTAFAADTLPNSPTTNLDESYSDAVVFNSNVIVSTKGGSISGLSKFTVSTQTWNPNYYYNFSGSPTLTANVPHPLCVGFTNELLIGNDNVVVSITGTAEVLNQARLTLPSEYQVTWIRSSNSQYWFGTKNKLGGLGKVFSWDGAQQGMVGDYKIGSSLSLSGVIKDEIPHTINGNGQLMRFEGGGFAEKARLPIANDQYRGLSAGDIHQNGMVVIQDKINVLVKQTSANALPYENFPSGIWEFTDATGLYHKYGLSKYVVGSSTVRDFGSPIVASVGALFPLEKNGNTSQTPFFAGAKIFKQDGAVSDTSTLGVVNQSSVQSPNLSYFITPQIYGDAAEEMWQKVFLTFRPLLTSGDAIKLAYRTSKGLSAAEPNGSTGGYFLFRSNYGTWTSTTTFTTTASNFSQVVAGNEVEILSGEGSGLSAYITTISSNAGTYTVTLDQAVTGASGTLAFRVVNWTKIDSITDLVQAYKEFGVGVNSNWVQFKVIMYNSASSFVEVEKLFSLSQPQRPIA